MTKLHPLDACTIGLGKLSDKEKKMAKRNAQLQRRAAKNGSVYGRGESAFGLARAGMYGKWAQAHPRAFVNLQEKHEADYEASPEYFDRYIAGDR